MTYTSGSKSLRLKVITHRVGVCVKVLITKTAVRKNYIDVQINCMKKKKNMSGV